MITLPTVHAMIFYWYGFKNMREPTVAAGTGFAEIVARNCGEGQGWSACGICSLFMRPSSA
jgi:hypothetical protein